MPLQLEKESNGIENLAFNFFWEFQLQTEIDSLKLQQRRV